MVTTGQGWNKVRRLIDVVINGKQEKSAAGGTVLFCIYPIKADTETHTSKTAQN